MRATELPGYLFHATTRVKTGEHGHRGFRHTGSIRDVGALGGNLIHGNALPSTVVTDAAHKFRSEFDTLLFSDTMDLEQF